MPTDELMAIIDSLSPQERAAVLKFIEYLRYRAPQGDGAFLAAVDDFIDQHPELLRRLGSVT
jgi:hypothetical protein